MRKVMQLLALGASLAMPLCAARDARASLVTVTGGFTGYKGKIGCDYYSTRIAGQDLAPLPAGTCDVGVPWADADLTFSKTSNLAFEEIFPGLTFTANRLVFETSGPQVVAGPGVDFFLGTFAYTNGTWFGSEAAFHLVLNTTSSDPLLNDHTLDDWIVLTITPTVPVSTGSAEKNADSVHFKSFTGLGTLSVYEIFDSPVGTNTGSVKLFGRIGSLTPTAFVDPQGGAFIGTVPSTVPEPNAVGLSLVGLGMLFRRVTKRKGTARDVPEM